MAGKDKLFEAWRTWKAKPSAATALEFKRTAGKARKEDLILLVCDLTGRLDLFWEDDTLSVAQKGGGQNDGYSSSPAAAVKEVASC